MIAGRTPAPLPEPGRLRFAVSLRSPAAGIRADAGARQALATAAASWSGSGTTRCRPSPSYPLWLQPAASRPGSPASTRTRPRSSCRPRRRCSRAPAGTSRSASRRCAAGMVRTGDRESWRANGASRWFGRRTGTTCWSRRPWPARRRSPSAWVGPLVAGEHRAACARFAPYAAPWNLAGLPAVVVPVGVRPDGLPAPCSWSAARQRAAPARRRGAARAGRALAPPRTRLAGAGPGRLMSGGGSAGSAPPCASGSGSRRWCRRAHRGRVSPGGEPGRVGRLVRAGTGPERARASTRGRAPGRRGLDCGSVEAEQPSDGGTGRAGAARVPVSRGARTAGRARPRRGATMPRMTGLVEPWPTWTPPGSCSTGSSAARRWSRAGPLTAKLGGPGLAQVREPAACRVVQGARRLRADLPADRGGAGPRRGGGQRRQPRPGRRARGRAARHRRRPCSCRSARRCRRSRPPRATARRVELAGTTVDEALVAAQRVRRAHRRGADPPVRPPGRDRRAGHGGLEILEQCPDVRTIITGDRRRRADLRASRSRPRRCGPDVRIIGVQAAGAAAFPPSLAGRPAGAAAAVRHDRRRHRGRLPGRPDLRARQQAGRRGRHGHRRGHLPGPADAAGAGQAGGRAGRRGRRGGAARRRGDGVETPGGGGALRRQHRPDAAAAGDRARPGRGRPLPARSRCAARTGPASWPRCWR